MKLLVLDRDGVINEDSAEFIKSPEEWQAIPGSIEAIAELSRAGWTVVVATNQSGVARGLFDVQMLNRINAKMHRLVNEAGGHIDAVFFCPHGPDSSCKCRKPEPGMVIEIAERYRLPAQQIMMVGDSLRDLESVAKVGGQAILVRSGKGKKTEKKGGLPEGSLVFDNLAAVAAHLLAAPASQQV